MSYWCLWCWWPLLAKLHVSKVMFPMTSTLRSPNWFTVFDSFVRLQSSKKRRLKKRTSSEAFNLFFRLQKCSSYVSVYVWLYVTTKAWHCVVSPKKGQTFCESVAVYVCVCEDTFWVCPKHPKSVVLLQNSTNGTHWGASSSNHGWWHQPCPQAGVSSWMETILVGNNGKSVHFRLIVENVFCSTEKVHLN